MKQVVYDHIELTAQGTDSRVDNIVIWQGGHGWLVVNSFSIGAGSPRLEITEQAADNFSAVTPPDIPTPITAPGLYPFFAPKGTIINVSVVVPVGAALISGGVQFLGDA